jgi:SANT/Myb-like domain of DAMP1/DNA methyltransferase 1-associated protein 1 (DMAP1)
MSGAGEDMFSLRAAKSRKKGGGARVRNSASVKASARADGVSREVYLLTGGVTPASLAPTLPAAALASKPVQKRAWERRTFATAARPDGLLFAHWARVGDPELDPFVKFKRRIRMVRYTEAEHTAVVAKLRPLGPTKELEAAAPAGGEAAAALLTSSAAVAGRSGSATVAPARAPIGGTPGALLAAAASAGTGPAIPGTAAAAAAQLAGNVGMTLPLPPSVSPALPVSAGGIVHLVPSASLKPQPGTPAAVAAADAVALSAAAAASASLRGAPSSAATPTAHIPSHNPAARLPPRSPSPVPSPQASVAASPSQFPTLSASLARSPRRASASASPYAGHEHHSRREKQVAAQEQVPAAASAAGEAPTGPNCSSPPPPLSNKKAVHFVPPQKLWTREETDALFQLCNQFELRFAVIHDRWPATLATRSVDELKDRYYAVAKAVVEHRNAIDSTLMAKEPLALQKHCQAINMNPFDYEYECIRKNQLERQYNRSKAELREEEETVRNARRIEAAQKRAKKERERLAKLLTPAGDVRMTAPNGSRVVDAKIAANAAAAAQPQKIFPHRKVNNGAFARSSMIYTPVTQSARIAKRVDQVLEELKVGTRPTPTSYVVDTFDLLRMDIMSYLELHRTIVRKEEETQSLRVRLAKLNGEPAPPPPTGVTLSHRKRKADEALDGDSPLFS